MAKVPEQVEGEELRALRSLPVHAPDARLDQVVRSAALAELKAAGTGEVEGRLGWLGRLAVEGALALTTVLYLHWALLAASSLY